MAISGDSHILSILGHLDETEAVLDAAYHRVRGAHTLLGNELRKRRERERIGLREVSRRLQLPVSVIRDLEMGRREWTPEIVQAYVEEI